MTVFTDKMDHSTKISLYEYKIIRNPETSKCVICTNTHELESSFGDLMEDSIKPKVRVEYITFEDVVEALEDVDFGYFKFIGGTRKDELKLLDNENLTHHIYSLEQWCGWFQLTT